MIKNYTLNALQQAVNLTLSLDETRKARMQALQGKVIKLIVKPLNVIFYIRFSDTQLELRSHYEDAVDTTIESSPLGLIRLSLLPASKVRSLFNDQIKMSGNVEVGQQVKQLFDELDIDWEGHLAQFTGDVIAFQIGSMFRKGRSFKNQFQTSLQQNVTEYLQEELRMVPSREEMEDFFHDVDELSLHVERLQALINQLKPSDENN